MFKYCSEVIKIFAIIFFVSGCLLAIGEISDGDYVNELKAGGSAVLLAVLTYGFSIVVKAAMLYLDEKSKESKQ
jgi:hypothetical protein